MKKNKASKLRNAVIISLLIILASIIAILSKAFLPNEVNIEDTNGILVKLLGFPIVASLYFVFIYSHNALVTWFFGKRAKLANTQIGVRFGICFALIYFMGMQEIVVEASPFSTWGIEFIIYQIFMGLGEAIAALALCIAISKLTLEKKECDIKAKREPLYRKITLVAFVALMFTLERAICYHTGIIGSDVDLFPVPVYLWTILFGIMLGCCYFIICPIFDDEKNSIKVSAKIMIVSLGICWMMFNLFIGLIMDGAVVDVLLRSGLDILTIFLATVLWKQCMNKK